MKRMLAWFQNWPRWLIGGLLSVTFALLVFGVSIRSGGEGILMLMVFAPSMLLWFLAPEANIPVFIDVLFTGSYFFLLGALPGRFVKKWWLAVLIWIVALWILTAIIIFPVSFL